MTDTLPALSIARDLLRCPSVTPEDAGALGVLETILKAAGFEVHASPSASPAPPISTISMPASAPRRRITLPDIPTWCRRATRVPDARRVLGRRQGRLSVRARRRRHEGRHRLQRRRVLQYLAAMAASQRGRFIPDHR